MKGIVSAFHSEAKAIIEGLKLKRDFSIKPFQYFRSDQYCAIICGLGKLKAAICTTFLLTNFPEIKALINLGICGSAKQHPIGELYLCNKVSDMHSAKCFYPDILFKHGLNEESITTFDAPVTKANRPSSDIGLVDMEASGFMAGALTFLAPSKLALLKIVADHLESSQITEEFAHQLISNKIEQILEVLNAI